MASLNDLLAAPGFKDLNPAERRASIKKVAPNLPDLNDDEIEHIRQRVVTSRAAPQPISIPMYNRGGVIKEAGGPPSALENVATFPMRLVSGGAQQLGQGMTQVASPESGSDFAGGASNIIRGAMGMASPFAVPYGLATAPVSTILGTGVGMGAGAGAEGLSRMLGVPEGYAEAIGTGTGIGAGAVAGGVPYMASSALRAGRNLLPYLQNNPTAARVVGHSLTDLLPIPGLLHPLVHAGVERMLSTEAKPMAAAKPTIPTSAVGSAPLGSTGLAVTPPPIPAVPPSAIGAAPIGSTGELATPLPSPAPAPRSAVGGAPFGTSGTAGGPVGELHSSTTLGTWYGGIPEPGVPKGGTTVKPMTTEEARADASAALHGTATELDLGSESGPGKNGHPVIARLARELGRKSSKDFTAQENKIIDGLMQQLHSQGQSRPPTAQEIQQAFRRAGIPQ